MIPLIRGTRIVKSTEMESRKVVPGNGGGGSGELLFNRCGVSAEKDENVLKTILPVLCTLTKMIYSLNQILLLLFLKCLNRVSLNLKYKGNSKSWLHQQASVYLSPSVMLLSLSL